MFERYACQIALPEVGFSGQQQLQQVAVLCVGAGGLGCSALQYLVSAGIGKVGICDGDKIDLSNLQRQVLYSEKDIHQKKSTIACQYLQRLNSQVLLQDMPAYITVNNVLSIISGYDYILDATDNFQTKLLLNDACHTLSKPLVSASVERFQGQCSVFWSPHSPCLRCLFDKVEPRPSCAVGGVLGMLPGWFGIMQAFEIVKICLRLPNLLGKLWYWDALGAMPRIYQLSVSPDCPLCTGRENFDNLWQTHSLTGTSMQANQITVQALAKRIAAKEDFFLLDVRNPDEYAVFNLGGVLIPLAQLKERLAEIPRNKPIVAYCHSGYRSQVALEFLQSVGFVEVCNLTGGVVAWQQAYAADHV
jgi:molybdopterin/thiamine biosynthesis adenylyltransferase/rhodanese-related sulfurtransferase